jgi:hypothetical protein
MSKRPPHNVPLDTPDSSKAQKINKELLALQEGGTGGRSRTATLHESRWHLSLYQEDISPDSDDGAKSPLQGGNVVPLDHQTTNGPAPTRSIIDNRVVSDLVYRNALCRFCKEGDVTLSFMSLGKGIATVPRLACSKPGCSDVNAESELPRTTLSTGQVQRERLEQWAINVEYVLSFMASGDGGTEAGKVLGFLNLPNATTMGPNSFTKIERKLHAPIIALADELVHKQVFLEVRTATEGTNFDYDAWVAAVNDPTLDYPLDKYPALVCCTDGAWNQRSAGRSYNSSSGFSIMVGTATWMPIAYSIRSTFCRKCSHHLSQHPNDPVPIHKCEINHEGSAGKMESAALLSMYHYLYDRYKIVLKHVVTDDDSTMKARCRWSNADFERLNGYIPQVPISKGPNKGKLHDRPDNGLLRYPIPEPEFLADPAHRKKTFRNKLYAHKSKAKKAKENALHDVDIIRLTRNFAYMSRQLKDTPKDKWPSAGKAVVDHHFDKHDGCGDFCRRKKELAEGSLQDGKQKVYRSIEKEPELYSLVCAILADYITMEKLEEIGHGFHTNVNESFNNLVAWIAPKNKVYSGSGSLVARIAIAIGMKLAGFEEFFRRLYQTMGIAVEPGTWHFFQSVGDWKKKHKERSELTENKQKRHQKTNEKIKRYVEELRKARRENDVYQTGIAMEADQQAITGAAAHPVTDPRPRMPTIRKACACTSTTHQRTSHRECPLNPKNHDKPWAIAWRAAHNASKKPQAIPEEEEDEKVLAVSSDGEEQDALDMLDVADDSEEMEELCKAIEKADKQEEKATRMIKRKPIDDGDGVDE